MRDERGENEFFILVGGAAQDEIVWRDGNTYIVMPLFHKTSYGVEFKEEIKSLGAVVETFRQKWPVCPYAVGVMNKSEKGNFAQLHIDGQKVAEKYVPPGGNILFEGIPTSEGIQELLFSLPRFPTLREKDIGGRALPESRTSDIGTIKVVWRDCVKTGKSFVDDYRTYGTSTFKQANKGDAKATGGGAGSGSSEKAFASTTRAGKVIALNEARACSVTKYQYVGEPWSARLLYRTQTYLEDIGVLEKKETAEEVAERKARRKKRRKKSKEEREAAAGGAPVPPPVPLMVDEPPPVASEEEG
ncbi:unnamed protein product [Scytosiphon promiscuus]